ncbi:MAG: PEGA domain protein [Syntrophorhabdaceae bacterium PtaU1.Bin034]|nr:MAG: PEGA domain protein [Syntrophorhabdaceae bacterium PtaU1.Bin034]
MNKMIYALLAVAVLSFGCSAPVLKQDVPVSTNPVGAKVFADGVFVGYSPTTVSLERTRDHILTLIKDNYRQEDVQITRQYQQDKVMLNAIRSGVNSGLFFKDARMGMNSGFNAIDSQEKSGEAYILVPPIISITLYPLYGPPPDVLPTPPPSSGNAPAAGQPLAYPQNQPYQAPASAPVNQGALTREAVKTGAAAALSNAKPLEKTWQTSSSTRTYTKGDGTRVTEKSGSSVGVSANPAGLVDLLDVFFK